MSHIILIPSRSSIDEAALDSTLEKMHLRRRHEFNTEDYRLIVHLKANAAIDSDCLFTKGNDVVFVSGTFFYGDLSPTDSIKEFYQDVLNGTIDARQMYGQFVIVAIISGHVHFYNDALGCHRIFRNSSNNVISTSFLVCWFAANNAAHINADALREKALTGYIVYPNTLVREVKDITYEQFKSTSIQKNRFEFEDLGKAKGSRPLQQQVDSLRTYFAKLKNIAAGKTVSLGVSGGFDSRLLLSLISQYRPLHLYTHLTRGVHDKEASIARQLAAKTGETLHIEETERPENLPEKDQLQLLDELIYYYDGRTANNSGAFSITGTYQYNHQHLQHVYLGLNGKGGEVYRNYYNYGNTGSSFSEWYETLVLYPSAERMLDRGYIDSMLNGIKSRLHKRLGINSDKWGRWDIQRYYSEVRQPDCESSIVSAHNKITHYLSPFFERSLVQNAYNSFEKIGGSDEFQASLIAAIDPQLAGVKSKYGYNFISKSFQAKLKDLIARNMPLNMKRKKKRTSFDKLTMTAVSADPLVSRAISVLKQADNTVNWQWAFFHYAQKNVCINLARLLEVARDGAKLAYSDNELILENARDVR